MRIQFLISHTKNPFSLSIYASPYLSLSLRVFLLMLVMQATPLSACPSCPFKDKKSAVPFFNDDAYKTDESTSPEALLTNTSHMYHVISGSNRNVS